MFLQIHDNLSLGDVQDRFADCFPSLRINFYSAKHKRFEPTDETHLLQSKKKVGDVRKHHNNGALELKSWYTVALAEKKLKEVFGLNAQIFRCNQKGKWIQTSLSDALTLAEQSAFEYESRPGA